MTDDDTDDDRPSARPDCWFCDGSGMKNRVICPLCDGDGALGAD